jgi:4-hydroxy-tetrahydrodipicolinate reductase
MNSPIRVLIHGASGRMGRALLRLAVEMPTLRVVAAVTRAGAAFESGGVPVLASDSLGDCPVFDVAIDFSLPDAFDGVLALCVARQAALVSGTTGLSLAQLQAMERAGAAIPVLWASNFSLGVAVLEDLVRRAANALADWDVDIVEAHHVHKKDAPSGTALTLGRAVTAGGGHEPSFASLRAGDIVGEHTVQFSGPGERIELIHRATNRDIFARGALSAALRLAKRPAGQVALAELLFAD